MVRSWVVNRFHGLSTVVSTRSGGRSYRCAAHPGRDQPEENTTTLARGAGPILVALLAITVRDGRQAQLGGAPVAVLDLGVMLWAGGARTRDQRITDPPFAMIASKSVIPCTAGDHVADEPLTAAVNSRCLSVINDE